MKEMVQNNIPCGKQLYSYITYTTHCITEWTWAFAKDDMPIFFFLFKLLIKIII